jgi:hypothetical protein
MQAGSKAGGRQAALANERTVLYRAGAVFCGLLQVLMLVRVDVAGAAIVAAAAGGPLRCVQCYSMRYAIDMRCDGRTGVPR